MEGTMQKLKFNIEGFYQIDLSVDEKSMLISQQECNFLTYQHPYKVNTALEKRLQRVEANVNEIFASYHKENHMTILSFQYEEQESLQSNAIFFQCKIVCGISGALNDSDRLRSFIAAQLETTLPLAHIDDVKLAAADYDMLFNCDDGLRETKNECIKYSKSNNVAELSQLIKESYQSEIFATGEIAYYLMLTKCE